jgi:tetratricopeptide (TPR) repeat protein
MQKTLTLLLLLVGFNSYCQQQQTEELWKLYIAGRYDEVIEKTLPLLDTASSTVDLHLILGRSYTEKGDYKNAISYLEYAEKNDKQNSYRKAWAKGYLGTSYYMTKEYAKSKKVLEECFQLRATNNVTQYAHNKIVLFGFHDFYKNWKLVETNNFKFYFQDMAEDDIAKFVSSREFAYQKINDFFKSTLPKKIDFFVWNSREDAKRILNAGLGFANPEFCIVHCHYQETKGHEMTHVISHHSIPISKKSGLINEGTSVYFDQTDRNEEQLVKDWLRVHKRKIDIKELWINWKSSPEELSYPLSGVFIKELIDSFGREKFMTFFKLQTYENALQIFGGELDAVIVEVENKFN